MSAKGDIVEHKMFVKALGAGCAYGCNVGFIKPMDFTFASLTTLAGKLRFYTGEGKFTGEDIGKGYFGCGGVAEIPGLQDKLVNIGYGGFRHHVSVGPGRWPRALKEAFVRCLGYEETCIEK